MCRRRWRSVVDWNGEIVWFAGFNISFANWSALRERGIFSASVTAEESSMFCACGGQRRDAQ